MRSKTGTVANGIVSETALVILYCIGLKASMIVFAQGPSQSIVLQEQNENPACWESTDKTLRHFTLLSWLQLMPCNAPLLHPIN